MPGRGGGRRKSSDSKAASVRQWQRGRRRIWVDSVLYSSWLAAKLRCGFKSDSEFIAHLLCLEHRRRTNEEQERESEKGENSHHADKKTKQFWKPEGNSSPLLEVPEPSNIKEEEEEEEEEETDVIPVVHDAQWASQIKEEEEEPAQIKEENEEEDPQHIHVIQVDPDDLWPPQIKEPEPAEITVNLEEMCTVKDEEQFALAYETDLFMGTMSEDQSEHDSEQLLSDSSAAAPSLSRPKEQRGNSGRNVKPKLKKKYSKSNEENSPASENQCEVDVGEKCLKCDVCGKKFKFVSEMKKHQRMHTGEKPFCCHMCGKSFSQKHHLKNHMIIHTGERPCFCENCGKSFRDNFSLSAHMRTHTGEKPFSCDTCGKSFSEQSSVLRHTRVHTGEKPHGCATCGKRFRQHCHLVAHVKIHTRETLHYCSTCGQSFNAKGPLLYHMRIHADEETRARVAWPT